MANFVAPQFSKKAVSKAGARIAAGTGTFEDVLILENWRASHAYVINTFQANLRRRTRNGTAVVGTRLKRRATIQNKLQRFPTMQLGRMHDIAGCRIIFRTIDELEAFRSDFHKARFAHVRKSTDEERWNYIDHPKEDGYRGIHDVYEYNVRSQSGVTWNGLQIEVQYRTLLQHSWATAVEVAGLLTHNNPKFGQGSPELIRFFAIASELLARHFEDRTASLPSSPIEDLKEELWDLDDQTRILQLFRRVNSKIVEIDFKKNNILIFPFVENTQLENESELQIESYYNVNVAIDRYNELEKQLDGEADVVLVRTDSFENLKVTFRNYFADTSEFIANLDEVLAA
jgi:ppGpp synthetase/RelA/SpoT-type nucleotidyltranferase